MSIEVARRGETGARQDEPKRQDGQLSKPKCTGQGHLLNSPSSFFANQPTVPSTTAKVGESYIVLEPASPMAHSKSYPMA
ncbi:hypothetical protein ACRALDRAFT_207033 [Sodiomyces alcalophilus JCM 7366]|uniref:uncharacterized protein n=1 Tax=Sodiomyces alcalophilus JCM 7366 TaxID=591952 RepID=UPI0039B408F5